MSEPKPARSPSKEGPDGQPTAMAAAKAALRARARQLRAEWGGGELEAWSRDLRSVLAADPRWSSAEQVVAFLSLPGEPDLRPSVTDALARGVVVWLPRVASPTELEFVPLSGGAASWQRRLARSPLGIDEPARRPDARRSFIDTVQARRGEHGRAGEAPAPARLAIPLALVLIPGLAFGRDGARLGFGRGYYDRVLAPLRSLHHPRPALIGVGFAHSVWEAGTIPMAAHDVPVDAILTERGMVIPELR